MYNKNDTTIREDDLTREQRALIWVRVDVRLNHAYQLVAQAFMDAGADGLGGPPLDALYDVACFLNDALSDQDSTIAREIKLARQFYAERAERS